MKISIYIYLNYVVGLTSLFGQYYDNCSVNLKSIRNLWQNNSKNILLFYKTSLLSLFFILISSGYLQSANGWDCLYGPTVPNSFIYKFAKNSTGDIYAIGLQDSYSKLYKSSDFGNSWKSIYKGLYIFSLTVDDSDNVYLAANTNQSPMYGVWKSTNGGKSFFNKILGFNDSNDKKTRDIYFAPNGYLYAAAIKGIYKSDSRAEGNWRKIMNGIDTSSLDKIRGMKIIMGQDNYLYAALSHIIYYSTDDGEKWNLLGKISNDSTQNPVYDMRITKSGTVLATGQNDKKLYISYNRGATWVNPDFSKYDTLSALALEFINGDEIITGTNYGIFKSTDEGKNWVNYNAGLPVRIIGQNINFDNLIYCLWQNQNTNEIYAGFNGYGIYKSVDTCKTWWQSYYGLNNINFLSITGIDDIVFSNSDDDLHFCKFDYGNPPYLWNTMPYKTGYNDANPSFVQSINKNKNNDLIALYKSSDESDLLFSTDLGKNWIYLLTPISNANHEIILDFTSKDDYIYAMTYLMENSVNKSRFLRHKITDIQGKWNEIANFKFETTELLYKFSVSDDGYIYATAFNYIDLYRNKFFRINSYTGKCDTFELFSADRQQKITSVFITSSNTKLITTDSGYVYRFVDSGSGNWQEINLGLNAKFTQDEDGTIYAANGKIKSSIDDGASWQDFTSIADDSIILIDSYSNQYLYAATNFSVYVYQLSTNVKENPAGNLEITVNPNPAANHIVFNIKESISSFQKLIISNFLGQEIYHETFSTNQINCNTNSYENGIYFYKYISGNKVKNGKFVILK